MVAKERLVMLQMEQQLLNDTNGHYNKGLVNQAKGYLGEITQKLNKGDLTPEEFEAYEGLKQALESAETVIKTFNR